MTHHRACGRRDERGFTLVELLIATVITMLVLFVTLALADFAIQTEPEIADRNTKIRQAQVVVERMVREVRQAYDVIAATSSSLTVLTYANRAACGSGGLDTARRCQVVYSCSGGTCTRTASEEDGTATGPARQIVSGLSSDAIFSYTPSAADAQAVSVTVELPADDGSGDDAITVTDGAVMRNMTDVLGN
jgi:prepilin-type N-terminal cleavage/methylation domain-containing protein